MQRNHPSNDLNIRSKGYGIAAGYERKYEGTDNREMEEGNELYGPIPHSGYYGAGVGARPFKKGQASFSEEMSWYSRQYGEWTVKQGDRDR